MRDTFDPGSAASGLHPEELSTGQLFQALGTRVGALVQKEVALARAEIEDDLKAQGASAKAMGAGALLALLGVTTLLVSAVLALGLIMAGWLAALLLGGALVLIGGSLAAVGWSRRVKFPLATTLRSLKQDVQWAKETLH